MSQFQVLLVPVLALMGLAFFFNVILRNFHEKRIEDIAFGLMFGVAMVIGMTNPISLGEGLIFDTRTLLLASAVAFVGPTAGMIALAIGIACRIVIGGAGTVSGVVGLILAFGIALLWTRYVSKHIKNKIVADISLGLAATTSIIALFILPYDVALGILDRILPTLVVCNTIGIAAVGLVFRREVRHVKATQEMEERASRDPLTNLLNRRGFDDKAETLSYDPFNGHALLYFDVDNFKQINDSFGHDAGDATLAVIATRIADSLRNGAIFSRQGGDEFSIYMPSIAREDIKGVADRICKTIADHPLQHNEQEFSAAISMGGYWTRTNVPLQTMIDHADGQLLIAKKAGKNRAQALYEEAELLHPIARTA